MTPFPVELGDGRTVTAVHVVHADDLPAALRAVGLLDRPRPVVVVVGGAGRMSSDELHELLPLFVQGVVPVVERLGAVGVDGGTRAGVMLLFGRARTAAAGSFPLVGVVAGATVEAPGTGPARAGAAELDPDHTHVVVVPGDDWGDETPWIAGTAAVLAGGAPSVTVLVNGGDIAWSDVQCSVEAGRPVLVLDGSGRTADELAAALRGERTDPRALPLAASGLVRAVPVSDPAALAAALDGLLDPASATSTEPLHQSP